ncbi:response regulator transcription factor [Terrarubrum flagellatum]|uniref:response regulator transcription factor n=1 Tax=Terrirubrum flagellatum TaxID=2895980 RepID=UPI003144ECBB
MRPTFAPASGERVLLVEDDPVTRGLVGGYFTDQGFQVTEAATFAEGLRCVRQSRPDLALLDVVLPDGDGFELARQIQAISEAGIIFITRRDSDVDRIVGLELAADHYVTKPINLRDLLARARSVLRRKAIDRDAARRKTALTFGRYLIDFLRRELATSDGDPIRLTRGEFDLLAALVDANGRALSREYLIEVISNRGENTDIRSVDALVARLRRKLSDDTPVIETVTGFGYRLGVSIDH